MRGHVYINYVKMLSYGVPVEASHVDCRVSGCDWVSDTSIAECITNLHFEDVSLPQQANAHHAARVAALVFQLVNGAELTPIWLRAKGGKLYIFDGSHRLRALEYLRQLSCVPAYINVDVELFAPFFVHGTMVVCSDAKPLTADQLAFEMSINTGSENGTQSQS